LVRCAGTAYTAQALERGLSLSRPRRCWPGNRKLAAKKYDTSKRRKPGRPPTVQSIARLAVRLGKGESAVGHRRIHGELTNSA